MHRDSLQDKKERQKMLLRCLENEWEDLRRRLLYYIRKKHYYKFANQEDQEDIVDGAILRILDCKKLVVWSFEGDINDIEQIKTDVLDRLRWLVDDLIYREGKKSRLTEPFDPQELEEPASTAISSASQIRTTRITSGVRKKFIEAARTRPEGRAPFIRLAYDLIKVARDAQNQVVEAVANVLIENSKMSSHTTSQDIADRLGVNVKVVYNAMKCLKRHLLKRGVYKIRTDSDTALDVSEVGVR